MPMESSPHRTAPDASRACQQTRALLQQRLSRMRLFGRDALLEQILSSLGLPMMQPATILVAAPVQAGKTRALTSITRVFRTEQFPVAELLCKPAQDLPGATLTRALHQLTESFPPEIRTLHFEPLTTPFPWLPVLIPALRGTAPPAALPTVPDALFAGLQALLIEMARLGPLLVTLHRMSHADTTSLDIFATVQATAGQGLRLLGSCDTADGQVPAALQRFLPLQTTVLSVPTLSVAQLLDYLREVTPEIAEPEVATALHDVTGGLPLSVETTLCGWADEGLLAYDGVAWRLTGAPRAAHGGGLTVLDEERLRKASVAGLETLPLLAALWTTDEADARATIHEGRAVGLLHPETPGQPERMTFTDPEQAEALSARCTADERCAVHAQTGALLEELAPGDPSRTPALAYHFAQAGDTARAQAYQQALVAELPSLLPILTLPNPVLLEESIGWDIPPAAPIDGRDLPLIIEAVQTIRLVGVQYRLYPPTSEFVRQSVQAALQALDALFARRPSLIIAFDGHATAFDGQILQRREMQFAAKDFQTWMREGNLRAVGFKRGVTAYELGRFLQTLVTFEAIESPTLLLSHLTTLDLHHIKVLGRSLHAEIPQAHQPAFAGGAFPGSGPTAGNGAGEFPRDPQMTPSGALPDLATLHDDAVGAVPSLVQPDLLDLRAWEQLSTLMTQASIATRRMLLSNLAHWNGQDAPMLPEPQEEALASFLHTRVQSETDLAALRETLGILEKRMERMITARDWPHLVQLLDSVVARERAEAPAEVHFLLRTMLDHLGESASFRQLISSSLQHPEELEPAREIVVRLGTRAMRPLIAALKTAESMSERMRLMQLLREFGDAEVPMLLQELRAPNPWYVYRNLLQVLAEVGNEEAVGTVSDKLRYPDPRVRAEAVTAAVKIARINAMPHLAQALEDEVADVRARAASLVGLCPHPRILELVLHLLQGTTQPDNVQLAACLALGQFTGPSVREALGQILFPKLLSRYRGKSGEIRQAAVSALAADLDDPAVHALVLQAARDKHPGVRQTAQRLLAQQQMRGKNPSGA